MGAKTVSLQQGAQRLNAVVREMRERQQEFSGADALKPPILNPTDEWSRKFLAKGFGPDLLPGIEPLEGTPMQQSQLMQEIKARAAQADTHANPGARAASHRAVPPAVPMQPLRTVLQKRSFLGRLFGR